jgi:hypothetical protein
MWGAGAPRDIERFMQADFTQIWRCCAGKAWVKWNANYIGRYKGVTL